MPLRTSKKRDRYAPTDSLNQAQHSLLVRARDHPHPLRHAHDQSSFKVFLHMFHGSDQLQKAMVYHSLGLFRMVARFSATSATGLHDAQRYTRPCVMSVLF
eukprot:scaffold285725_cov29-Tisochrysis_lutea.AAC.1